MITMNRIIIKKSLQLISGIFFFYFVHVPQSYSQSEWTRITPENTFFSFEFPGEPQKTFDDTLIKTLMYSYIVDTDIVLNCTFMKKDSSFAYYLEAMLDTADTINISMFPDSILNPLNVMREGWTHMFDSSEVLLNQNFYLQDSTINGMTFGMRVFRRDSTFNYFYVKAYYNGHDYLFFFAMAPENEYEDLIAYRDEFFDSITIEEP